VHWAPLEKLQDQHVQRALQNLYSVFICVLVGHDVDNPTLNGCRMSTSIATLVHIRQESQNLPAFLAGFFLPRLPAYLQGAFAAVLSMAVFRCFGPLPVEPNRLQAETIVFPV
jgi:hypothetical protein